MALSYTKLVRFDLLKDLKESLLKQKHSIEDFLRFLDIYQEIINADRFIKELPSFPHSTKNIIRGEMMSAIGSTLAIEGIFLREDEISEALQEPDLEVSIQRNKQEVLNSRNVYNYIRQEVNKCEGDFVYTIDHICKIHELFTEHIDYPGNQPGSFRNCTATFGYPRKPSLCDDYKSIYQAVKYFVEWLQLPFEDLSLWFAQRY